MNEKYTVGSLFSGIRGIELGFEAAGFHTEWFVECEPFAQAIIRKNWPDAVIYDDVTTIDWTAVPKVDILTGGFPCQDISNAGKRIGITGSRSSLWKHYLEAIRVLRPKFCLIENVSALIGRGLYVVLADLASLGYDAEWHCVSTSAVGANHRRDRIFIIAYTDSQRLMGIRSKINATEGVQPAQRNNFVNLSGSTRSNLVRAVYGIPNGAHRIYCLGNAVVPQVAEVFAQAIKEVI